MPWHADNFAADSAPGSSSTCQKQHFSSISSDPWSFRHFLNLAWPKDGHLGTSAKLFLFDASKAHLDISDGRSRSSFLAFPRPGLKMLILNLSMFIFGLSRPSAWPEHILRFLKLIFGNFLGPGSDILILKFVYLKADSQDFSIPGSDVDFEALEPHFRHFSGLHPTMSSFNLWSSFSAFPSPWFKHLNGEFSKLLVSIVLKVFSVTHGFEN